MLLWPSDKIISEVPKTILDSLKSELDKSIKWTQDRWINLENTKNELLSIDHEISRTLPKQINHLSSHYPVAKPSAINGIRRVLLPELMHDPRLLLWKNSARIDPTYEDGVFSDKISIKLMKIKQQPKEDNPKSFESILMSGKRLSLV